ncbi:MAG TPA: leucyl aminopeptidase [Candidatus Kapabacteria bacterium]|nr:leucyl aminopeptidase [Candidatus Kapabacteria bacterium]
MKITIQRFKSDGYAADATAVFVSQDKTEFGARTATIRSLWGAAANVLESNDFTGARDSAAPVYTGSKKMPRLIMVGTGGSSDFSVERLRRAASVAAQRAAAMKCTSLAIVLPSFDFAANEAAQAVVEGAVLSVYSFDKYFTENKPGKKLERLLILVEDEKSLNDAKRGAAVGEAVVNGVVLARDLANAPSNEIYPESLAEQAKGLSSLGVKVTVLNKTQITRLGMGGLLAVNQGSEKPPFFAVMEWNGGRKGEAPVVLVGKGITFDSGGISIKPSAGMGEMKMDMGGAAAVIGTMRGIAELKLNRNVVGLVPTTENMPSGSAYKPGDVITFMNGKTAEIDNTDAEGRLILADALCYASRYKPQAVIDLATLTGACVIALGNVASGLMGNNPALNGKIVEAGSRSYDRVVELPLWEEYEELIKSDIADVKNSGGRAAGTITAALFLQHFVDGYPWAHLDIAGSGMVPKGSWYVTKGGTGAGVRLLIDLLRNW